MKKVNSYLDFAPKSIINKSFGGIDYSDAYHISFQNPQNYSIDYLAGLFFTSIPSWIKNLLSFRNFLVRIFGLKAGSIDKLKEPDKTVYYEVPGSSGKEDENGPNRREGIMNNYGVAKVRFPNLRDGKHT